MGFIGRLVSCRLATGSLTKFDQTLIFIFLKETYILASAFTRAGIEQHSFIVILSGALNRLEACQWIPDGQEFRQSGVNDRFNI